jgi:hypothetical protein
LYVFFICVRLSFVFHSLNDKRITALEELGHMAGVCTSVLKQRSVTRVRVNNELRIGQMRAERERIDRRNHDVVFPVRNKHRLRDLLQISIGLASGLLPGSHRRELRSGRL